MRNRYFGFLLAGAVCVGGFWSPARAQDAPPTTPPPVTNTGSIATLQQEVSLAEAARKARADKKNDSGTKKVWNDDNIPRAPREVPATTAEGGDQAARDAAADGQPGAKPAAGADDPKKAAELEAKWREKFAAAQKKIDDDEKDIDLMQRELNLKRQQYYSDPNTALKEQYQYPSGRGGEVNDLVKKIDETKLKLDQDKQALSDLEDELRKAGLPAGWARP